MSADISCSLKRSSTQRNNWNADNPQQVADWKNPHEIYFAEIPTWYDIHLNGLFPHQYIVINMLSWKTLLKKPVSLKTKSITLHGDRSICRPASSKEGSPCPDSPHHTPKTKLWKGYREKRQENPEGILALLLNSNENQSSHRWPSKAGWRTDQWEQREGWSPEYLLQQRLHGRKPGQHAIPSPQRVWHSPNNFGDHPREDKEKAPETEKDKICGPWRFSSQGSTGMCWRHLRSISGHLQEIPTRGKAPPHSGRKDTSPQSTRKGTGSCQETIAQSAWPQSLAK